MASIISIVPIVLLFVLMLGFKMAGHKSALLTLVVTVLLALFAASPLGMIAPEHAEDSIIALTGWAVVEGLLKAVFPILIIILMAIYSYNILVESKQIEVIKKQFTSITDDKGLLVLLLVWGFGGLLEGMAGFGTAVAIPAAILIGLGFKPMFSALVSLVGNTVATGFGAVGVPVTTLCNEGRIAARHRWRRFARHRRSPSYSCLRSSSSCLLSSLPLPTGIISSRILSYPFGWE